MLPTHCDDIKEGDNVIIGLGDSFTQGVGAYSLETWKSIPKNPATYNISGTHFLEEQSQNNWVRQLANRLNYKTFNLGVNGSGNRSTIREMFLNKLPDKLGNVIVILLATGMERYDFIKQLDDTTGLNWHQKWQTIFPNPESDRGAISKFEKEYFKELWSSRNDAIEFLFNINDAKNYCVSRGYKFLFSTVFDERINKELIKKDLENKSHLIDLVDWNDFVSPEPYTSLMDMIYRSDGNEYKSMHDLFALGRTLSVPTKYVTPCAHWTIEGQHKVAEFLYEEIKKRNLI
jgi:hypothetical protein